MVSKSLLIFLEKAINRLYFVGMLVVLLSNIIVPMIILTKIIIIISNIHTY